MKTFRLILVVIIVSMAFSIACAPVDETKQISYADAVRLHEVQEFQDDLIKNQNDRIIELEKLLEDCQDDK